MNNKTRVGGIVCEYCGCRRIPEIARLGTEHELIEELAERALALAEAGSPGTAVAVDDLRAALDPHVRREEAGVFTLARREGLTTYLVDLEDDHERFAEMIGPPGSPVDIPTLSTLVDELHRHIAIEEYEVFPAVADVAADDYWVELEPT